MCAFCAPSLRIESTHRLSGALFFSPSPRAQGDAKAAFDVTERLVRDAALAVHKKVKLPHDVSALPRRGLLTLEQFSSAPLTLYPLRTTWFAAAVSAARPGEACRILGEAGCRRV